MRSVIRFERAGKLVPRYIGPFKIIERIGQLIYKVELPERLSGVHNVFHMSHLRKYVHDPSLIVELSVQEDFEVKRNLMVIRHPVKIIDQDEKRLRNKVVKLVKI